MDGIEDALPNRRLANFAHLTTGVSAGVGLLRGAFQTLRESTERYFQSAEDGQELWSELERNARQITGALFELVIGTDDVQEGFRRAMMAVDAAVIVLDSVLDSVRPLTDAIRGPLLRALEAFTGQSQEARRELAATQAQFRNAEQAARGYEDALRSLGGDSIQAAQGALDALTGTGADYEHGLHIQMDTIRSVMRVMDEQGSVSLMVRDRTLDALGSQTDAFVEFQRNARRALEPYVTQLAETGDSIETLRGQHLRFTQAITGTDGLTRNVQFAVPVLDLLNQTMINGQPAAQQLAVNLDTLNRGYAESAQASEMSAQGTATAEGAYIGAAQALEQQYNPAIQRALDLLTELQPTRDKVIASLRMQKQATIDLAVAEMDAELQAKTIAQQKLERQRAEAEERARIEAATAEQIRRANDSLAASYYDLGSAVGDGTDSITQATIKAATDQLRALILRYIGEAAALGAVGRIGASVALGAAVGVMQRSLSQLGGGGSASAAGAAAVSTTRTVQNISVSVAQTNGLGAGVDSTRAIGAAVEDGIRRGLINLEGRR
jgi:hypothetical protein